MRDTFAQRHALHIDASEKRQLRLSIWSLLCERWATHWCVRDSHREMHDNFFFIFFLCQRLATCVTPYGDKWDMRDTCICVTVDNKHRQHTNQIRKTDSTENIHCSRVHQTSTEKQIVLRIYTRFHAVEYIRPCDTIHTYMYVWCKQSSETCEVEWRVWEYRHDMIYINYWHPTFAVARSATSQVSHSSYVCHDSFICVTAMCDSTHDRRRVRHARCRHIIVCYYYVSAYTYIYIHIYICCVSSVMGTVGT